MDALVDEYGGRWTFGNPACRNGRSIAVLASLDR